MKLKIKKHSFSERLISFIYPTKCFCCGTTIGLHGHICEICRDKLEECRNSRAKIVSYNGRKFTIYSQMIYKSVAESAIKLLKFSFCPDNAKPIGDILAAKLNCLREKDYDIVTAVPMTAKRKALRGYNQAELIARRVSKNIGVVYNAHCIKKTRETKQQHTLSGFERRANVRGAYSADNSVLNKSIILVDDVVTTGATICECATALLESGARKVTCITFAVAKYSN